MKGSKKKKKKEERLWTVNRTYIAKDILLMMLKKDSSMNAYGKQFIQTSE